MEIHATANYLSCKLDSSAVLSETISYRRLQTILCCVALRFYHGLYVLKGFHCGRLIDWGPGRRKSFMDVSPIETVEINKF